ncbi:MAG: helicase HerA domain-containing protein [Promethearchaeota archaeon]
MCESENDYKVEVTPYLIINGKISDIPLLIDGKDLNRHMAVFGMAGDGKGRFVYGLIKIRRTRLYYFD